MDHTRARASDRQRSIGRGIFLALLFVAGTVGRCQETFQSLHTPLHIKGAWNGLPVMAITERTQVVIDYERAAFTVSFDPGSLHTGVGPIDSVLTLHAGTPIVINGVFPGVKYIETRSHGPMELQAEGRLAHAGDTEPFIGNARLEHIFAGTYACLLELTFNIPVERLAIRSALPGLSGGLYFHMLQTLLKRPTD